MIHGEVRASDGTVELTYRATLDDFDRQVSVEPPPSGDVAELRDIPALDARINGSG